MSNCWFVKQEAENVAKWSDYLFMTSIQFLVQREMVEIAPRWGGCMHLPKCTAQDVRLVATAQKQYGALSALWLNEQLDLEWPYGSLVPCRSAAAPKSCS